MDVNFRKIDIDIYDEDALQESEIYNEDPRDPGQVLAEAKHKQTAVRSALARCVRRRLQATDPYEPATQERRRRRPPNRAAKCALRARRRRSQGLSGFPDMFRIGTDPIRT